MKQKFFITGLLAVVLALAATGCSNFMDRYAGDWGLGRRTRADSVIINNGATVAYTTAANLSIYSAKAVEMRVRNDDAVWSGDEDGWVPYSTGLPWNLVYNNGTRTVYLEFRDIDGTVSSVLDDILLIDRINASNGTNGAGFGRAVGISEAGDRVVVGAPVQNMGDGGADGAAYVYDLVGGVWEETDLTPGTILNTKGYFGDSISISGDGNTVAVGAYRLTMRHQEYSGSIFIYRWDGAAWQGPQQPDYDYIAGGCFGGSVSVSHDGSVIVVGAPGMDDNTSATAAGKAYVFTRSGNVWNLYDDMVCPALQNDARFGDSVAVSGDGSTVAVGSPNENHTSSYYNGLGYVRLYDHEAGYSSPAATITVPDSDLKGNSYFGSSISMSSDGSTIAIGARGYRYNENDRQGAVYIYENSGSSWEFDTLLYADNGAAVDFFGGSVSLSPDGSTLIVGAAQHDETFSDQGAVYLFEKNGEGEWVQTGNTVAADALENDWFGSSVAVSSSGNYAVGAGNDSTGGSIRQGSVYILTIE